MPPPPPRPRPNDRTPPRTGRPAARRLLALACAAGLGGAAALAQTGPATEPDPENGHAVVVGAYTLDPEGACFRCHGQEGAGDTIAGFPRLADQYENYLHGSLRDYASGARPDPIMTPIAEALTEQEMRDVAAYYALIEDAPYARPPEAPPKILAEGEALAMRGAPDQGVSPCANCHGADGVGQPPFFPFLAGQGALYIERQLLEWKRGERGGDPGNVMAHIADRLSYAQIRAVALYYASLRPEDVSPVGIPQPGDAAAVEAPMATEGEPDAYPTE